MAINTTTLRCILAASFLAAACGGDDDGDRESLFQPEPECEGQAVAALMGQHPMVISAIEIGSAEEGFDLDGDGEPDNQLAVLGGLANNAIEDAFENFEVVIPIEFFDMETPGADSCVKFAVYLGEYRRDADGDGADTAIGGGDCNDHDAAIHPGAEEIADNGVDDDCDGLADETIAVIEPDAGASTDAGGADGGADLDAGMADAGMPETGEVPSDDDSDADGDGVSLAAGDCDDTRADVAPGMPEICGDGLDNDCDGVADFGPTDSGAPACSPYDDATDGDPIGLDPTSFDQNGNPVIAFTSGEVVVEGDKLILRGGPAFFSIVLPINDDVGLELRLTGATIEGELVMTPAGWSIVDGRLGGVIDAYTADQIRGLEVSQIGLRAEDSLLDAVFANALGGLLGLPLADPDGPGAGCYTPDVDVDRDGLEAFCDSVDDTETVVTRCVDGDGTVIDDEGEVHCASVLDGDGDPRFVDGISVMMRFEAVPTVLPATLP